MKDNYLNCLQCWLCCIIMAASILFSAAFCRSIIVVMRSTPASCVAGPPVCDRAFQGNEERWQHMRGKDYFGIFSGVSANWRETCLNMSALNFGL